MQRSQLFVGFLLGVVVALAGAFVARSDSALPTAQADAAGGQQMFAVVGTGTQGQSRDVLFLIDPSAPRLAVYEYKDGRLELGAVRNIEFDLRFQEYAPRGKDQRPSVRDMKQQTESGEGGGSGR